MRIGDMLDHKEPNDCLSLSFAVACLVG